MTSDQNFLPGDEPRDDVEGHGRVRVTESDEDVEGHGRRAWLTESEEDVEGHGRARLTQSEEDVEGHVNPKGL